MAKNERTRTMVYSNVNKNKKADKKSASKNDDIIDLDDEIVIGLARFPEPEEISDKKKKKKNKKAEAKKNEVKKAIKKSKEDKLDDEIEFIGDKSAKVKRTSSNKENREKNGNKQNAKQNNKSKVENNATKNPNGKNKNTKQNNKSKVVNNATKNSNEKNTNTQKVNPKTSNIQQKIKKQKIRAIRKMATCLFLTILLIGGFVYFLLSPVFNIKNIEVINNSNIPKDQIITSSGIILNENMFKISTKEAENKILANPYVESVEVDRKLFDKIQIDVKERTATLMLEYGNSYVYINNQGYILEITTTKLQAPILTGYVTPLDQIKPGNRLSKDDLERLKTVLNIMESANTNGLEELITKIDIKSKKNYKLTIESEDKIVHLGECSDLSTQMLFVKEMLEREKGIEGEFFVNMDLNTGDPVFREKV